MKFLLITVLLSSYAFADHHEIKAENIAEMKQKISANIDQKISALQEHKTCVQAASTPDALRSCKSNHKVAMKKLHEENKGERAAMKEKMKMKREERKSQKSN